MRILVGIVTVLIASCTLLAASASFASAGNDFDVWTNGDYEGSCHTNTASGEAEFRSDGEREKINIKDHGGEYAGPDHYVAAELFVRIDGTWVYKETFYNKRGNDTTRNFVRNYAEGRPIKMGVYEGPYGCGYDEERGIA